MTMPVPPDNFQCWLDYAIATIDARGSYLDRMFTDDVIPTQDQIRAAAQDELDHLKQKAAMPWIGMLEKWQTELSNRLGRSAASIVEQSLLATDFSNESVHIRFEDGSDLTFQRAFYLGKTPADGTLQRIAVFTEHCGYHEFWIGPNEKIETISPKIVPDQDLQWSKGICQPQGESGLGPVDSFESSSIAKESLDWDSMAPVGREFGSPDYDRLTAEDAVRFASDMAGWIKQCESTVGALHLDDQEASDAKNVQSALREFGHEVAVEVAASVWRHYSQSLMAGWLQGAESVESAARILYLNCPSSKKIDGK